MNVEQKRQWKDLGEICRLAVVCGICLLSGSALARSNSVDLQGAYFAEGVDDYFSSVSSEAGQPDAIEPDQTGNENQLWIISPGDQNLRSALANWTEAAGWQLNWENEDDVLVEHAAVFQGDFPLAVHNMVSTLATDSMFAVSDAESRTITIFPIGANR